MTKKIMFMVAAALCLTLTGCKESGDTDEPSDGSGGGGTVSPTPVPSPGPDNCATSGPVSGHWFATQRGVYADSISPRTLSTMTLYFAGAHNGSTTLRADLYDCGSTTSSANASATVNIVSSSDVRPATFNFGTVNLTNCNATGMGTFAIKITATSGANTSAETKIGIMLGANNLCNMKVSSDVPGTTAAAPTQNSTHQPYGGYNN
ncbi:hypothetical protein EON83_30695 [bacterium]|nr:MAG: hypothetical protein EON83_30695 [bacterium]